MEYKVWQKAEVWYVADVEADTQEQAIELAKSSDNLDWEIDLETAVFSDDYEVWE